MNALKTLFRPFALASLLLGLAGCDTVVLNPSGDIAAQQGQLILTSTYLMLLIIVPVIILTLWFAWYYRASNKKATYLPDWDHSVKIEVIVWVAPLLIIIALGTLTWITTHKLDPFRPLERISAEKPLPADAKPLVIQAVALDWKWLFFYPEQGIATVNEIAAPVDRPIRFDITASTVMNAFYIPALAGQIYAMPGMQTQINAVINKEGNYEGFSSNYSGAGFSWMRFRFHGMSDEGFAAWIEKSKQSKETLSRAAYLELVKPSEREPVRYYGSVEPKLYHNILNLCADGKTMCMDEMMAIDKGLKPRPKTVGHAEAAESTDAHAGHEMPAEHGAH